VVCTKSIVSLGPLQGLVDGIFGMLWKEMSSDICLLQLQMGYLDQVLDFPV